MAKHGTLLTAKFPEGPLRWIIWAELKKKLEPYAQQMKAGTGKGTSPASPGWWAGNIQSYIQVEDLGGGSGAIMFGVGLINGTPEQALWQAYIFNFGSGQYGKNGMITSQTWFYNVDTGYMQGGRYPEQSRTYPQFGKMPNHWFDDVSDRLAAELPSMMQEIVSAAIKELFASGAWTLKGHRVTVKL